MSVKHSFWAWEVPNLKPPSRLLLLALADISNETGEAYPSIAYLQRRTGMRPETIIKHARNLQEKGHLEIQQRTSKKGRSSNLYTLKPNYEKPESPQLRFFVKEPTYKIFNLKEKEIYKEKESYPQAVDKPSAKSAQKSKAPNKGKAKFDPAMVEPPPGMKQSDWLDFVEHRKVLRKPLTKIAVSRLFKRIERENWTPSEITEAIENSILNGWSGLFRPNPKNTSQRFKDYSGGDRQNAGHPDYRPVRGQKTTTRHAKTERELEADAQANKRTLDQQAIALLKNLEA